MPILIELVLQPQAAVEQLWAANEQLPSLLVQDDVIENCISERILVLEEAHEQ